jgi:DNA adenine methylase
LALVPPHKEYREPCCGGAGLFFHLPATVKRWLNDLDDDLMRVYSELRNNPEEFIIQCRTFPEPTKELFRACLEHLDNPLAYLLVNNCCYSGKMHHPHWTGTEHWDTLLNSQRLEEAARHLEGVRITSGDYAQLIEVPGEDVFVYVDPPYYKHRKWYTHSFSVKQHEELAERVQASPHKIMVSNCGGHPALDKLYQHCRRFSCPVQYQAGALLGGGYKPGEECVYLNW